MPLLPGVAQSLLSPSMLRIDPNDDQTQARMAITDETCLAVDMLKQLMSMLSLAIQALYGSKRGGLLGSKSNAKGGDQSLRAKRVFVSGAKEYVPILLQVVSLLDEPITWSKKHLNDKIQHKVQTYGAPAEKRIVTAAQPSEPILRKRTDSTDVDWVDIPSSTVDIHHDLAVIPPPNQRCASSATPLSQTTSPSIPRQASAATLLERHDSSKFSEPSLEQCVHDDLISVQDMTLYAVSRLVAQAMMYGGGEASTAVWRSVITSLSDKSYTLSAPVHGKGKNDHHVLTNAEAPIKSENTLPKSALCHLAALVLSKFARHHDHRLETYRSPWNLETCSATARLMDLVEEKELISQSDKTNRRGSIMSYDCNGTTKYAIDQVRLLKALLEVMASGRECGGWAQIKPSTSSSNSEEVGRVFEYKPDAKSDKALNNTVENSLPHSNYELYHQVSSSKQHESLLRKPSDPSNSKLLLPILQSCVRIVVPATGTIRSEALVISAAAGNSPSTSILLELVCAELDKSLVAAIQGLGFPISRDIFMNAVATFRRSITHHQIMRDTKAVELCSTSVMTIVRAMSFRYMEESIRKDRASFDAYEDDETTTNHGANSEVKEESSQADKNTGNKEGLHSQVVERLILGENALPENGADFVSFPGDANLGDDPTKLIVSPMGWSHYKGLGAALKQCYREEAIHQIPEEKAAFVLSILECYIDNWDKIQIQDAAEAELVDLFDESIHLDSNSKSLSEDLNALSIPPLTKMQRSGHISSSSASDAMTRFIEVQSILRHQHQYLAYEYFLRRRFGRTAFVERLCWNTWMDCIDAGISNCLWERVSECRFIHSAGICADIHIIDFSNAVVPLQAVNDGGRDFPSKIATVPVFPQFPRFIPSYLDHSPELLRHSSSVSSTTGMDIKLLSQSVKIVDITKREISEDMLVQFDSLNESRDENAMADDFDEREVDLHFTDRRGPNVSVGTVEDHIESATAGVIDTEIKLVKSEEETPMIPLAIQQGTFHFAASSFSYPPDSSSLHSLGEGRRLGGGSMEEYYSSCLHVKPDCR